MEKFFLVSLILGIVIIVAIATVVIWFILRKKPEEPIEAEVEDPTIVETCEYYLLSFPPVGKKGKRSSFTISKKDGELFDLNNKKVIPKKSVNIGKYSLKITPENEIKLLVKTENPV